MKKIIIILALIAIPITVSTSGSYDILGCEQVAYNCPGQFGIPCGEPIYGCFHDFGSINLYCCPNICGNCGRTAHDEC